MSVLSDVLKFGKDVVLLSERVEQLASARKDMVGKLEDHERRLIRIETMIEVARATPRLPPGGPT
jgi:hypothetical protein